MYFMLNVASVPPLPGTAKGPAPADSACCRSPGRSLHTQRGELSDVMSSRLAACYTGSPEKR